MALGKRPYRVAIPGRERALRCVSPDCERLMLHLWYGAGSGPVGIVDAEPDFVATRLRVTFARAVALLEEAAAARLIVRSPEHGIAYTVGHFLTDNPAARNNWLGLLKELPLHPRCAARAACETELGRWPEGGREWEPGDLSWTPTLPLPNAWGTQEQEQEQEQDPDQEQNKNRTVSPSAPTVAVAPDLFGQDSFEKEEQKPKAEKKTKPKKEVTQATVDAREVLRIWNMMIEEGELHQTQTKEEALKNTVLSKAITTSGGWWALIELLEWAGSTDKWGGNDRWTMNAYAWLSRNHLANALAAFRNANGRDPDPTEPPDKDDPPQQIAPSKPKPLRIRQTCPKCGETDGTEIKAGEFVCYDCAHEWKEQAHAA